MCFVISTDMIVCALQATTTVWNHATRRPIKAWWNCISQFSLFWFINYESWWRLSSVDLQFLWSFSSIEWQNTFTFNCPIRILQLNSQTQCKFKSPLLIKIRKRLLLMRFCSTDVNNLIKVIPSDDVSNEVWGKRHQPWLRVKLELLKVIIWRIILISIKI